MMMGPNFRQWGIKSINHQVNLFIHLGKKNHRSGESLLKEYKASAATFLTE